MFPFVNDRVFIVAEVSGNHCGSLERCKEMIRVAKQCGADAVKLQTFEPSSITLDCRSEHFVVQNTGLWDQRTLHDLYKETHTPREWHAELLQCAQQVDIVLFSTPFSVAAVDFLESLDFPMYKVASFENNDLQLLKRIARTGKPVIMSTGMADLATLEEAVKTLRENGCKDLALLKCTSAYPADPRDTDLRTIPVLATLFNVVPGLSDHTLGPVVPIAAVSLGARIVEKHFILDRALGGPDASFSLEPAELRELVAHIRLTEKALGQVRFGPSCAQEQNNTHFRRSLFVAADIKRGELITCANVRSVRPSVGMHTRHLPEVLGQRAACDLQFGTPLQWDMIARHDTTTTSGNSRGAAVLHKCQSPADSDLFARHGFGPAPHNDLTDRFMLQDSQGQVCALGETSPVSGLTPWATRELRCAVVGADDIDRLVQMCLLVSVQYSHPVAIAAARFPPCQMEHIAAALGMSLNAAQTHWIRNY